MFKSQPGNLLFGNAFVDRPQTRTLRKYKKKKTCCHIIMLRIIAEIVKMLNAVYHNNNNIYLHGVRFPTISPRSAVSAMSSNVSESLRSGFVRPLYRRGVPIITILLFCILFLLFDSHSADRSNPFDRAKAPATLVLRSAVEFSHGPSRCS